MTIPERNYTARKDARRRLNQQLKDGTRRNGEGKASGHALKQDLHEGKFTVRHRFKSVS